MEETNNQQDRDDEYSRSQRLAETRSKSKIKRAVNTIAETGEAIAKAEKKPGVTGKLIPIKLAVQHRKKIRSGDFSPYIIAFAFAAMKDVILDLIPIAGTLLGGFISMYLLIFLWGKGSTGWKVLRFFLLFIDLLAPFVKLFPISVFCVFVTYRKDKKAYEDSKYQEDSGYELETLETAEQEG